MALSLLFAQWEGIHHKHAHAEHIEVASPAFSAKTHLSSDADKSISHSCLLFDALTLGAALQTYVHPGLLLASASGKSVDLTVFSWSPPFVGHFCPRAPPLP
jgi:hypothetical protein